MTGPGSSDTLGDEIARQVIAKFHSLPKKGKPQSNGVKEWTVVAGLVAIHTADDVLSFDTIAITTGVKSLPDEVIKRYGNGKLLHDCHAEILAIRGLNRFLIDEYLKVTQGIESGYLETSGDSEKMSLKKGISFALYVSEPPCGDSSLELLYDTDQPDWESNRDNELEGGVLRGRENYKMNGRVRTKPGRRDSPRTLSKSCSDKLALCQFKSILNGMSTLIIHTEGVYLRYLVIPDDKIDNKSFQRCFRDRFKPFDEEANPKLTYFDMVTTSLRHDFERTDSMTASGNSLIYLPHSHIQESIQKGVKEGFYSKKQYVRPNGESVLSRYQLFKQIQPLLGEYHPREYLETKSANAKYISTKQSAYRALRNWNKTATDNFTI